VAQASVPVSNEIDRRYYDHLISCVPPESHSVPLILHCLLEQVSACNLLAQKILIGINQENEIIVYSLSKHSCNKYFTSLSSILLTSSWYCEELSVESFSLLGAHTAHHAHHAQDFLLLQKNKAIFYFMF